MTDTMYIVQVLGMKSMFEYKNIEDAIERASWLNKRGYDIGNICISTYFIKMQMTMCNNQYN